MSMKIDPTSPRPMEPLPIGDKDVRAKEIKNEIMPFRQQFQRLQGEALYQRLQRMADEITEQGKRLSRTPTYRELKMYRELIRQFVREAVQNTYVLQNRTGWDRRGRQKIYTLVQKIDTVLAELTELVKDGQENQLEILAKLDVIRGMLVDLYT
ncbi:MAG: YaaR family protein [Bacillota bacterium]|nr:YaaR family protein [Negativicutes bacterium]